MRAIGFVAMIEPACAWYPEDDSVHGFDHVMRVLAVVDRIGQELGADVEILRMAALFLDAAGVVPESE